MPDAMRIGRAATRLGNIVKEHAQPHRRYGRRKTHRLGRVPVHGVAVMGVVLRRALQRPEVGGYAAKNRPEIHEHPPGAGAAKELFQLAPHTLPRQGAKRRGHCPHRPGGFLFEGKIKLGGKTQRAQNTQCSLFLHPLLGHPTHRIMRRERSSLPPKGSRNPRWGW